MPGLTQWKPGQSGNPKGRPPKERELARMLRGLIAAKGEDGVTHRRAILTQIVTKARNGDLDAIKVVLDRIDGKAVEEVRGTFDSTSEHSLTAETIAAVLAYRGKGRGAVEGEE